MYVFEVLGNKLSNLKQKKKFENENKLPTTFVNDKVVALLYDACNKCTAVC